MSQETFDAFVCCAMYLADHGDGALEPQEMRAMLHATAKLGGRFGLDRDDAHRRAEQAAQHYVLERDNVDPPTIHSRFQEWLETLRADSDESALAGLYQDLVQVAVSDGEVEKGEEQILLTICRAWGIPFS